MIKNLMTQFVKEEDGGLVEYLILIAIAAVAAALMFPQLRRNLATWFNQMVSNVDKGITGNGGAGGDVNTTTGSGTIKWGTAGQ